MQAAEILRTSAPLAFTLDIALALALLAVKAALFAGILELVSRRRASLRVKTCVLTAALLSIVYFLSDTTPEAVFSIRAFLLVVLIGTFLCIKLFEISLETSLVACLLFCCLSILVGNYSQRGVDRVFPGRITIGGKLVASFDNQVRKQAKDSSLPSSTGVVPALVRLLMTSGAGGIGDALLAPMRAFQQAKEKIAVANKAKAEEASIVNLLSGAGTNVGDRTTEMAALHKGLAGETLPGSAPSTGTTSAVPSVATTSKVVVASAAVSTDMPPVMPTAVVLTAVSAVAVTTASPSSAPGPVAAIVVTPAKNLDKGGGVTGLEGLSAADRLNWEMARQQIRVSSVVQSSKGAYIMINGRVLRAGATHKVVYRGNEYTFRFRGLDARGGCKWEAVVSHKEATSTDFIAF